MMSAPSSTWFSAAPHWGWYITLYFFLGGLAGGCYLLAAVMDVFGRPADRPLARLGYYVAFPCVVVSGLLLTIDLGKPLRFWHMLIQNHTFRPMFKYWSPMSLGAWALMTFGLFTFLAFLGALAEDGANIRWPAVRRLIGRYPALRHLRAPTIAGKMIAVVGALFGLYIAGYTGVLLAVTNRPIWSDTPLLGMLFIVSAASTSAALLILLAQRYRIAVSPHGPEHTPGLAALRRFDDWVIALELIVLAVLVLSLGPVLQAWLNIWGLLLLVVVVSGLIVPVILSWRAGRGGHVHVSAAPTLVLIGGLLLRAVIIFSAQAV
jgi:protein NrfD